MKKRTVITTEKREVWVIRQPDAVPEAKDQTSDVVDSANESLVANDHKDTDASVIQPQEDG